VIAELEIHLARSSASAEGVVAVCDARLATEMIKVAENSGESRGRYAPVAIESAGGSEDPLPIRPAREH